MDPTVTKMRDPAIEIHKEDLGDKHEFVITYYKRLASLERRGWMKKANFYSFTIMRKSPVDGKVHRFFREKDADVLLTLIPQIKKSLAELKQLHGVEIESTTYPVEGTGGEM